MIHLNNEPADSCQRVHSEACEGNCFLPGQIFYFPLFLFVKYYFTVINCFADCQAIKVYAPYPGGRDKFSIIGYTRFNRIVKYCGDLTTCYIIGSGFAKISHFNLKEIITVNWFNHLSICDILDIPFTGEYSIFVQEPQ